MSPESHIQPVQERSLQFKSMLAIAAISVASAVAPDQTEASFANTKLDDADGKFWAWMKYKPQNGGTECHITRRSYSTTFNSISGILGVEHFVDTDGDGTKTWEPNTSFGQPGASSEQQPNPHLAKFAIYKDYNPKRMQRAANYEPTRIACTTGSAKISVSVPRKK